MSSETDAHAIEIWRLIDVLTRDEGNTVIVLAANADFNGQPGYAIDCSGEWTGWADQRFAHDSRIECFRMAFAAWLLRR